MGSKISIDKHVSNIEDILEMNPTHFSKLKIENSIPNTITQHIKIWRYYEDDKKSRAIKSSPLSLKDILSADFNFVSNECYLVLFVYKKRTEEGATPVSFPHSMWGVVESSSNLTPRGLETPVANSESISSLNRGALESFLLPKRAEKNDDSKFEYMLFVWNGKTANPLMKAVTLSAAIEFDSLINKAKDPFLHVLFSGGYVRNKKLWIGKILQLDSSVTKEISQDFERKFEPLKDSVYLLKFLFPGAESRIFKPSGFKERFLKPRAESKVEDEYVIMGEGLEEEEEEYIDGASLIDYPASMGGRESEQQEEETPPASSRRDVNFRLDIPKFPFAMGKNLNLDVKGIQQDQNAQNSGSLESERENEKPKKGVPMIGLNLANAQAKMELNLDGPNLNGASESVSQDRSEDDPPMSSGRTLENQDSRRKSDKRAPQRDQPAMTLSLGGINQGKNFVNNIDDLKKLSGDNYHDVKESDMKRVKREFFSEQCNAVIENFLFVAGETIAYNEKKLAENGITHILNAAGDACENKFPDKIKYLTFYLKDSRSENIECVFYEAGAFIESAKQQNGRVLVHCVQGVSRSVALCISYLIFKHEYTFNKAYDHIRKVREIASPNPAFWAQLLNFQARLYAPFDSLPSPRVFCIGSFQRETPQTLVSRMLFESSSLFNTKNPKTLDPRGVFILQSQDSLYLWIGNEILPANKDRYIEKAESYIENLQKYEHAPQEYTIVSQGEEPSEFWSLWQTEPQNKYGKNRDWDLWYVDLASHKNVEGTTIYEEQEEEEQEEEEQEEEGEVVAPAYVRPALYCYPELEPLESIEMEEMKDDALLILCAQEENEKVVYLCRGPDVAPEVEDKTYLASVLRQRWPDTDPANIILKIEDYDDISDDFINYFP